MPLTSKGEKILSATQEQYGSERGKEVFYAAGATRFAVLVRL